MRRLAPLLLLGGCLSAPTGLDRDAGAPADAEPEHVWPPEGDVDFQAIATGDFAGDSTDDVIAVNVGDDHTGVFLLVGGVDLDPGVEAVASTYTEYERIEGLKPPVAALVVEGYVVVLDNPSSGGRITVLSGDALDQVAQFDTGGPQAPGMARPVLKQLAFGMGVGGSLGIVDGDDFRATPIEMLEDASPDVLAIPAPAGGWNGVQTVDVYQSGGPVFFAAFGTQTQTSPVPTGGGSQVWTSERASTGLWPAQVFGSLPFDGVDDDQVDLIALDASGAGNNQICAIDAIANAAPTCLATPTTEDDGFVLLYDNLAPGPEDDLVVALPGPAGTRVDIFPTLAVTGGALESAVPLAPQTFAGANAHLATGDLDPAAGPRAIVQLAPDGALTCITVRPEGVMRCSDTP